MRMQQREHEQPSIELTRKVSAVRTRRLRSRNAMARDQCYFVGMEQRHCRPCRISERMMGKEKRAAIYLRVSTGEQTVDNQRHELEAAAASRGWSVVAVQVTLRKWLSARPLRLLSLICTIGVW